VSNNDEIILGHNFQLAHQKTNLLEIKLARNDINIDHKESSKWNLKHTWHQFEDNIQVCGVANDVVIVAINST